MPEFDFKIRKIKEKDYNKNKDPYIKALRKAAEPMRLALQEFAREVEEANKTSV